MPDTISAAPSEADLEKFCDAFDWDGWTDQKAAQRAFARAALAKWGKTSPPAVVEPPELSPDFTDTARAALLWVLWHHQGGSSPVGQPIRFALGMGQNERLNEHQLREAKRWERVNPSVLPSWPEPLAPVMTDVVGINARLHFRRGWRAAEFAHGIGRARSET